MPTVHQLSRRDARRIAVRAQLLSADRPTDLLATVRHLTVLQIDPISAVAPSAELVVWSRLGSTTAPDALRDALETQDLVELRGMIRPIEDVALHRDDMAHWPGQGEVAEWQEDQLEWVMANDVARLDVLDRLRSDGPLPATQLPSTFARAWVSSGWTNDKNLTQLLHFMVLRGEVAVAGRDGRHRVFDLAERVYPDVPVVPSREAGLIRDARRLLSLGIVRATGPDLPGGESVIVATGGERAVVEGLPGEWVVEPSLLGMPFSGRAALLSPFDRLLHDRRRMGGLFEFDYQLEMYKPAAKRRWGYYALPILHGDRLIGKLDAKADRKAGVFCVDALHEDVPFSRTTATAVHREITDLARWLRLDLVLPD